MSAYRWIYAFGLFSAVVAVIPAVSTRFRRWMYRPLGLAALALLMTPWLAPSRVVTPALSWSEALAYGPALATIWVIGRQVDHRATILPLAAALALAAAVAFWYAGVRDAAPMPLWSLAVQLPSAGVAGIALGAAVDRERDAERPARLALALESAVLLGYVVVRQTHLGIAWGWDIVSLWQLVCWLGTALACQAAVTWRVQGFWMRLILLVLGLVILVQCAFTAELLRWLGYTSIWIVG